jgi:hypothetical protein
VRVRPELTEAPAAGTASGETRAWPTKRRCHEHRGTPGGSTLRGGPAAEAAGLALAAAMGEARPPAPRTAEEHAAEIRGWVQEQRNPHTAATYSSSMRQFVRWAQGVGSAGLLVPVNPDAPTETQVAAYMRHLVLERGSPMATVGSHLAAIADHLKYVTTADYKRTAGPLVRAMRLVLKDKGTGARHMEVYVNEACKNDAERRGHTRVAAERAGETICVLRTLSEFMRAREGAPLQDPQPQDPLFPQLGGEALAASTPAGRLQHWLWVADVPDARTAYGFHSLRAGAATDAHRNGVSEDLLKGHGNWRSDAVKVYIRPGMQERMAAANALGRGAR